MKNGTAIRTKHALIGMGTVLKEYPLYAEASNEKGLSLAGLYFPENAYFFEEKEEGLNLAPYELFPYFLGLYEAVAEVRELLKNVTLTNIPFAENLPITDLHWMMSDGKDCIVLEQTREGLQVYDNPVGVLTNNPPFPYHLMNLNNYGNLTPLMAESRFAPQLPLAQYGRGMGAIGLPGDASPASRFVRAAFHKWNSDCDGEEKSSVAQFFHILDNVALVQGSTVTESGKADVTIYSCCINASRGIYYYKTYTNNQITAVRMTEKEKQSGKLSVFELREEEAIRYEN